MQNREPGNGRRAQSAIEYLLLLGIATAVALYSFRILMPRMHEQADVVFNEAMVNLMDETPQLRTGSSYP